VEQAAYIYDGVRTPFGRHGGILAMVRPDDLLAGAIQSLVARSGTGRLPVEDVIAGCTNQAGEDCRNVGRNALLLAGLPKSVGGQTVNRLCGSGLAAAVDAARAVRIGEAELVIACGVESMTRAPLVLGKADKAFSRDARIYDTTIGSRFPNPRLLAAIGDDTMPETAENIGAELGIGREASDAFALRSQNAYAKALAEGFFNDEIAGIETPARKSSTVILHADEHPRADVTGDSLAALRPLRAGGIVTAGNASGINDGAAAMFIGARSAEGSLGRAPLARVVSAAVAGVEPRTMGLGPVPAINKALERAGIGLNDCDLIEINEAFATQVLGCLKLLDVDFQDARVNPNGGAIAVGHPLGASGVRLAITATRELHRRGGRFAVVSLCIGLGQGIAMIIERV